MKIILDNIIFSLQKVGGISGSWALLIEQLLKYPELDIRFIERSDANNNIFRASLSIPPSKIIRYESLPLQLDRYMPVKCKEDSPFVFHSSYYRTCTSPKARSVVTLHDFIYEETHCHSLPARKVHFLQKNKALKAATAIAAISEATRSRLNKYYPNLKASIRVIGNPIVCNNLGNTRSVREPYILYVGSRLKYKNFENAVRACALAQFAPLKIVGAPLTKDEHKLLCDSGIDYSLSIYPDNEELSALYSNAHCLLFVSEHEGFGIPIIEAQAHGCPVIISNCDACMETGGKAVLIAPEADIARIAVHINTLQYPDTRQALIAEGYRNIQKFQSEIIASQYLALYSKI
ncbi:MAG: glycosyltransferase [Prevotella sp.]|nr:glycosyltransferase [Prevotella sp.]MCM1075373.1 glycosyltransferase [Ruminococcus sp.]